MTRTIRAFHTFATGVGLSVLNVVVSFACTPFLLRWLGDGAFGTYRVAMDWMGYLMFLELGVGGALLPLFANATARQELGRLKAILAEGMRAYVFVSAAMIGAGIVLLFFLPGVMHLGGAAAADLRRGWWIGLAALVFMPLAPFRPLVEASQHGAQVNVALGVQTLLLWGLGLFLAWRGLGVTGQFVAFAIATAVFALLLTWASLRNYPEVLSKRTSAESRAEAMREIRHLNGPMLLFNMTGRLSLATDNIIVAWVLGPLAAVPLILTQRAALLVQGQLQSIGNASWAPLADLYSRGDHDRFRERVIELTHVIAVLAVAALAPLAALNSSLVQHWVGSSRDAGLWVTSVACLNAFCQALVSFWGWCFNGTGKVRAVLPLKLWWAALNLTASILLTFRFGILGPILGSLLTYVCFLVWGMPLLLQRTFKIETWRLLGAAGRPFLWGVGACALFTATVKAFPPSNLLVVIVEGCLGATLFLGFYWLFGFNKNARALVKARLAHVLGITVA